MAPAALPTDDALDSGRGGRGPRLAFGAEGSLQWHCFTAMLLLGMLPFVDAEFALTYRPAVMAAVVWVFVVLVQWHRWRLWALRVGVVLMWVLLVGNTGYGSLGISALEHRTEVLKKGSTRGACAPAAPRYISDFDCTHAISLA